VDRDTPVSRTSTVAPESLARKHDLLREQRVRGSQKLLGPPTAELQTRGATAVGETKRRGDRAPCKE
jgi:hypothetical protein